MSLPVQVFNELKFILSNDTKNLAEDLIFMEKGI